MKLSMSTLGCPDWGFMKVLEEYKKLGCDIEVRGIDGEMSPPTREPLMPRLLALIPCGIT